MLEENFELWVSIFYRLKLAKLPQKTSIWGYFTSTYPIMRNKCMYTEYRDNSWNIVIFEKFDNEKEEKMSVEIFQIKICYSFQKHFLR